jgi:exodeoxyribonuclease-5
MADIRGNGLVTAWSPGQSAALDKAARWLQERDKPVFRLFGYAGTGKTTLARHLAKDVGGRVLFVAPTGRAA